ncbi:unnamed protein product, partial [Durusdinium trenchii]
PLLRAVLLSLLLASTDGLRKHHRHRSASLLSSRHAHHKRSQPQADSVLAETDTEALAEQLVREAEATICTRRRNPLPPVQQLRPPRLPRWHRRRRQPPLL